MCLKLFFHCYYRLEAIATRVEGIASRLDAIATRVEAIASRLEAIATRVEGIASRLEAIASRKAMGQWGGRKCREVRSVFLPNMKPLACASRENMFGRPSMYGT